MENPFKKIETLLGEQPYETILKKSKNPKVAKLLESVALVRILFFPVSVVFLLLTVLFCTIMFAMDFLASVTSFVYMVAVDARWMDLNWFGLTTKELAQEYIDAGGKLSPDGDMIQ